MDRLKRIRINSPRREERVKFLSDSESEMSQNESDTDINTNIKTMADAQLIDYSVDTDEKKRIHSVNNKAHLIENKDMEGTQFHYGLTEINEKQKQGSEQVKAHVKTMTTAKKNEKTKTKESTKDMFVEDAFAPELSPRPSSAVIRNKHDAEQKSRINLPTFPRAPKIVPRTSFTRVGGGWMKTEDYLRNHVPIRVYEYQRPLSGNSFLYLKSKFVSEKDNQTIVYKNRDKLLQSPRYHIPMSINDKVSWNKYDTFIPGS